jgi:ribonuclease HII
MICAKPPKPNGFWGLFCYDIDMKWIVGIDEVGRGPVVGPVAVCACAILDKDYKKLKRLKFTDSKKMSEKSRNTWYKIFLEMKKRSEIKFCVVYKTNKFIDKNGISKSLKECITIALKNLCLDPKEATVLLDGALRAPDIYKNQKTIIKGDQKEKIISLASIVAKVSRDQKMLLLHKKHPLYSWNKNKGYGTKDHYKAMKKFGLSELHRNTFLTKLTPNKPVT